MKYLPIIIISVLAIALIAVSIKAFSKPKIDIRPIPLSAWPAGCNPNNPGYDMNGNISDTCVKIYCAINPNDVSLCNASSDCYNGCLSSRPGYNCEGKRSSNC